MLANVAVKVAAQEFPADLSPYNAFFTIITDPLSDPNSGPASVQIFSVQGALRYILMSQAKMSKSFELAYRNAILTLSRDTTLA
eukprot:CAMPEP_0118720692 /NCGR_PEP_ID=MMETSP0800-20121206/30255_1 /TAXON_ID=210618 ORGANISM="Striatella unipunctata, Strain CCMP2910" /NCGR_SAMPLE_ID=MMETSP0800 /ASSEMBLY_ACC=CAM_ASM_000638 /LENGTH=83 /DNA_ID=CAMNT_0006628367 /DNA_START=803 /DNA_END=1054 /DNA_ORIENTATION=-